jgi:anti-sigma regulatory factor (Ser/Thr protein kinase)
MPSNKLRCSLEATPAAVAEARRLARSFARAHCHDDEQLQQSIELGVTEAVSNAVRHAYEPPTPGGADLEMIDDDDCVIVHVRDRGSGKPERPSGNPGAGLGLRIMHQIAATTVRYPEDGGTEVALYFPRPQGHPDRSRGPLAQHSPPRRRQR